MHRRQCRRLVDTAVRAGSIRRLGMTIRVVVVVSAAVVMTAMVMMAVVTSQQSRMKQRCRCRRWGQIQFSQTGTLAAPLRRWSGGSGLSLLGSSSGGGGCGCEISRVIGEKTRMVEQRWWATSSSRWWLSWLNSVALLLLLLLARRRRATRRWGRMSAGTVIDQWNFKRWETSFGVVAMSRRRTQIPLRWRRFVVVVASGWSKATLLGWNDQAEGLILFSGISVDGVLFFLLLLLGKLADICQTSGSGGGGGCGSRMDSGSNWIDDVVESGIGRLLLREEVVRKWAVGRSQEGGRRQTKSGQIAVSQSAVNNATSLQFA